MGSLFIILFLLTPVLGVIALIKPSLLTKIIKRKLNRKQIALIFAGLTILFMILGIANTPTPKSTTVVSSTPDNAKAAAALAVNTQHLEDLMNQGKQALGTTQYPDANAGLAAFNDTTSAASKYRDFHKDAINSCADVPGMTDASKQADSYFNANNEPAALNQWLEDMNQASSDLCMWVQDASGWQISTVSTDKLNADETKFNNDLALAKKDIETIKNGTK